MSKMGEWEEAEELFIEGTLEIPRVEDKTKITRQ